MGINLEEVIATTADDFEGSLGHLFWWSIGKQTISREDLEDLLIDTGVGEVWLPNAIRPVDAFRRATSEIRAKRRATSSPNVFENFLIREVYSDKKTVQRNIVVEQVDQDNKRLGYKADKGVMRLDKEYGTLSFEAEDPDVVRICEEVEHTFHQYRDYYGSQQVRAMIARISSSLAPTPVRRNGVIYFIPRQMNNGLSNLVELINRLDNSEAFKVPVVNTDDNVEMVSRKLNDHLDDLLEQLEGTEGLRKDQVRSLINETNRVIKDFKNYDQIILSEKEELKEKVTRLRGEALKALQELET